MEQELKDNYVQTIGKDVDDDAVAKIKRWKKAADKGTTDPMYQDIEAMEAFNMSWDELMALPERVYLSMVRIHSIKQKQQQRRQMEREHGIE